MFKIKPDFNRSEAIAQTAKIGHTVSSAYSLVKSIVMAVIVTIIAIVFMILGLPWYFGLIFIAFAVIIVILSIMRLKRVSSVRIK